MPLDENELTTYKVVVNHEEQYSIWPVGRENPLGWKDQGPSGSKADCLAYIDEVWTDMRPLSLRKHMEDVARQQAEDPPSDPDELSSDLSQSDDLITRLIEGTHPVEVGLHADKTVEAFKAAIDRGYVHIKFTETKGGTELGMRLDPITSNWNQGNFSNATGIVHLEGTLILNSVKVRCHSDIQLQTLSGRGHLQIIQK